MQKTNIAGILNEKKLKPDIDKELNKLEASTLPTKKETDIKQIVKNTPIINTEEQGFKDFKLKPPHISKKYTKGEKNDSDDDDDDDDLDSILSKPTFNINKKRFNHELSSDDESNPKIDDIINKYDTESDSDSDSDDEDDNKSIKSTSFEKKKKKNMVKKFLILKLRKYASINKKNKKYSLKNSIDELQLELTLVEEDYKLQSKIKFFKIILMFISWGSEKTSYILSGRRNDHVLNKWSTQVNNQSERYDMFLSKLVDKHKIIYDKDGNERISEIKSSLIDKLFENPLSGLVIEYITSMVMYIFASKLHKWKIDE
jgi:hypothetical protein